LFIASRACQPGAVLAWSAHRALVCGPRMVVCFSDSVLRCPQGDRICPSCRARRNRPLLANCVIGIVSAAGGKERVEMAKLF